MSRILVEVRVPPAGVRADVWIPYEAKLHEVAELVKSVLSEEVESSCAFGPDTVVCDGKTGDIFDLNMSPQEVGLQNGSKLMLV